MTAQTGTAMPAHCVVDFCVVPVRFPTTNAVNLVLSILKITYYRSARLRLRHPLLYRQGRAVATAKRLELHRQRFGHEHQYDPIRRAFSA